ncbi:Aste57867_12116 [Aphanomyces stellatus]|uniref:Aste57867_12116 protein n=1 Tax=Aphanomyces stellatus TaxID=120398 RepID=A0A485KVB2_9STRA|nr:hypothetical protein As57867_012071 [Aphanomyces stellatus]VFT88970.1 Aste57867_12116 [Aphanomyces stellatus]
MERRSKKTVPPAAASVEPWMEMRELIVSMNSRFETLLKEIDSLPDRICRRLEEGKSNHPPTPETITMTVRAFTDAILDASTRPSQDKSIFSHESSRHGVGDDSPSRQSSAAAVGASIPIPSPQSPRQYAAARQPSPTTPTVVESTTLSTASRETLGGTIRTTRRTAQAVLSHATKVHANQTVDLSPKDTASSSDAASSPTQHPNRPKKKRKYPPLSSETTATSPTCLTAPTFVWGNGQHRRVPEGWRCPLVTCKVLWYCWFRGDVVHRMGPFRFLEATDVGDADSRALLARGRAVVEHLVTVALLHSLANSEDDIALLPTPALLDVFSRAFDFLMGRTPDGTLARIGFDGLRPDQVLYMPFTDVHDILQNRPAMVFAL